MRYRFVDIRTIDHESHFEIVFFVTVIMEFLLCAKHQGHISL